MGISGLFRDFWASAFADRPRINVTGFLFCWPGRAWHDWISFLAWPAWPPRDWIYFLAEMAKISLIGFIFVRKIKDLVT